MASGNKDRFCSLEEYEQGISERLDAAELTVGGLYVVMLTLRDIDLAVRYPAKIADLGIRREDRELLGFVVLDDDLERPSKVIYSDIADGHLTARTPISVPPNYAAEEGYFAGYSDGLDLDMELAALVEESRSLVSE